MRVPQKLELIADYFATSASSTLPDDFFDDVRVVLEHRRSLSHGGFWGFEISSSTLDTHFFFSRFMFGKTKIGKRTVNFENRVLKDDTLVAIITRCMELSALLREAIPTIASIEEEITANFEAFNEEAAIWKEF